MTFERGLGLMRDALRHLALDLGLLRGWQRYACAFFAGALSVLALAPVHLLPVLFITFPILVWLLDGLERPGTHLTTREKVRAAAITGWWFGFGYFLLGLYWIGFAFMVEAEKFAFLMPFAVVALPAGLALFVAGAVAAARVVWPHGFARIVVLAIAWTICEWLRGHILTGFPWNLLGESFVTSLALMQWSAVVGPFGLTFMVLLIVASPAAFDPRADQSHLEAPLDLAGLAKHWAVPVAALVSLALLWLGGMARLVMTEPHVHAGDDVTMLRIVQPNILQTIKWKPENRMAVLGEFLRISAGTSAQLPQGLTKDTIVIWPESALSIFLAREPFVLSAISRILPEGALLITGSVRGEPAADGPSDQLQHFYNSLYVVNDEGQIIDTYDKSHLVPFGEYLPYHRWLSQIGLKKLTQLQGSFDEGPGPVTMSLPGAPSMSPLICYEIIFPSEVVSRDKRPSWIANVTNDAWFGTSSGPYQHLSQVRLRAVEQGMPVARAANTGVSAVIDANGRIVASQALNSEGVLDVALPRPLGPTPYARFGDWILAVLLILSAGGVVLVMRR